MGCPFKPSEKMTIALARSRGARVFGPAAVIKHAFHAGHTAAETFSQQQAARVVFVLSIGVAGQPGDEGDFPFGPLRGMRSASPNQPRATVSPPKSSTKFFMDARRGRRRGGDMLPIPSSISVSARSGNPGSRERPRLDIAGRPARIVRRGAAGPSAQERRPAVLLPRVPDPIQKELFVDDITLAQANAAVAAALKKAEQIGAKMNIAVGRCRAANLKAFARMDGALARIDRHRDPQSSHGPVFRHEHRPDRRAVSAGRAPVRHRTFQRRIDFIPRRDPDPQPLGRGDWRHWRFRKRGRERPRGGGSRRSRFEL